MDEKEDIIVASENSNAKSTQTELRNMQPKDANLSWPLNLK